MTKIKTWRFGAGVIAVPFFTVITVLTFGLLVISTIFSERADEALKELMEG